MLQLSQQTERLARLMAARVGCEPDEVIRAALEREARSLGVADRTEKRRMTVEEILAFGARATSRPVVDQRSPQEIAEDINAL